MERISSEVNGGSPSPSSSVSFSSWVPNTAAERGMAQSQAMTSVPPVALGPTSSELSLSSSNCPNCKLLSRHLKVSREWNNFFRLKLDQKDSLLHIAADYKRQKQQSLQLQMSLDQQSRECSEMREQLTNLLLEVKPLRERLQIAEQRVEEEVKRREKAESKEYNLEFLLKQQTQRIKDLENRDLSSVLEKKLNTLQARVKRLKVEDAQKSRTEYELREAASLAREREVCNLKKAHWGLSLAYKYGRRLLKQDKFPEGNSPKEEWSSLQNILKQVLQNLDRQYLAYCRKVPFHSLMEDWVNDFLNEDWQDRDAYGVESGAKQLERLIQDDNEEKISEGIMEEEKMIKAKQVKKTETKLEQRGSQDSCEGQHTISRYKKNTSLVLKHEPENYVLSSRNQGEVTVVSILDSSIESIDSDPLPSLHNNVEATPHMVDTEIRKEAQEPIRSASIKIVQQPIKSSSTKTTQDRMISPPIKTQEAVELTSIKKTQESVKSVSLLDTSMEDSDSDVLPRSWNSTENTGIQKKEQELMKSPIRKAQESVKSISLLDTSMEDSDSDVLPRPQNGTEVKASRTGIRKKMQEPIKSPSIRKTRELTKMTSILDTSMEDSDNDILPSLQSSTEMTAPCTENTQIQRKMQQPIKSPIRKTQKPIKSASLLDTSMEDSDSEVLPSLQNVVEKTISHTMDTGIRKKTQDVSKSLSILDTSSEDSDEEPSLRPLASTAGHSFDVNLKGTEELPMVTSLKKDHSDSYAGTSKETSPINSYHLDEELRAILQKMRPHKKLEDIDTSLSGGPSPLPETGMPVPAMKQDFLGSLSDSEEEEKDEEKELHEQDKAGMCVIPRILTTQISEEFVARSHKGSSLLDDLDISTDTIDQEREDEKEEKDNQTQVPLPHFQSSQSFSFDMEECHPLPSPQTLASMSGEISKEQHTHCQSQLPQSVDGDDNSMCGHQGDVPKENKVLLKEMRHLFGAVDDTTTISGRETEDSDHQSVGSAGKNDVLSMSGEAIHTELCQEGQASPDIQITENKLVEDIVNGSRSTAAQKEMNKEKEERSTEIEEENNGAALEGKNTEGMEKITIRADEDKTIAVKDRMEGDVDTVLTEREKQTTETAETRGKEVRGGFTETAEESTEAEEDRITVEKDERTTPLEQERTTGKEKKISESEKERNIFVNDMRNSEVEKQRTSKAQEGRIKDNEGNTENEDERTSETEQERTTRAEDERNDKNYKNGAAEEEEERTIEAVKEICTGIGEKGSLEVEKDQTGQDEEKVEDANDGTQETDTGKTIGEDVNTIEIEEIGTTLPEEEQTTEEEEKKTPQNKKRNPPQRKRRRSLRILDMLRKEIQEEEEEGEKERRNTDEEMERGHWTKKLSRQKKKDCGLDEEIQKESGQKSRQCIQRQLKAKTEEPHLVGGKGNRRKVEGMQETEEHNGEKIWDDKQKRWKERKRESEQEEESNKEDQGNERKQEEEKMKREMEKRRKQEKKTNQEKEKNEGIEQEKEEKKIMPENERKRRKSKRIQDKDKTLREEEEERKMKEEEERKMKEEEERKMKEERKRKMKEEEERKMKEEKERKMKEEKERKIKEEEERKIKEEEERKMKEERERKMKEEEERKMKEEKERKMKEEKERKMKEEEERKMKEERKRKMKEEEERKMKEEKERKMKEEKERKIKEEEERKIKEERERKMKEERERKMKEEEERKMKEEKERKMKEEAERKMKEERKRKMKEEEERKMKEEKERKMKEEKERKIKEEEERKIKEERERKMKEEEERERKMKEEEERKMKEEKERKMKEEKERKMKEEKERKMKEERKRKMKEEEERKMKEEREKKMKEEEERKMKEEKERKMKEEKERKIKEEEDRKIKEEEERKMKEEERKMKEKEKRWMKEIEERKIKGKEERKTRKQKEMERKILEDKRKRCEQKRKREEESELCNNTEEKLCELESKQRERKKGETEIQQQEEHKRVSGVSVSNIKNSACGRGSDIKPSQKETIRQTHPPDNSKKQEKIVFSWGQKRRQWRKFIKFHRMSRLTRVLPDPFGSLHHSVFVMECRADHRSAQEQTNRKSTTDGWLVKDPPLETLDVQISCGQEREKGKENNRARDSMAEEIPAIKIKTSSRKQKIKEKMRHLWDEQTCRGKKAVTRKSKRISKMRDSSNSSSDRNRARNKSSSSNSRSHSRNRDRSSSRNRDESNSSSSSSRNGERNNSSRSRSNIRNRDRSNGSSSNSRSHSRNRDRSSSRNRDKSNSSSSSSRNIDRNNTSSSIRNKDRSRSNNSSSSSRNRDRSSSRNRDRSSSSSSSSSSIRNRDRNNSSRGNRNRDRSSSISSRSSSSSSFTRETMCTVPREVKSGDRAPQQPCSLKKNAKTDNLGALAKSYKTRTSKAHLFGIDSDNSCSSEDKGKEQVKKNRKDEKDEQQEPPASLHNKRKNFRSSLLVATKVGGKRKSIKQPQLRRSRRFSSSYSSLPASQTMYSSEEELASRRGYHSSGPETDLSTSDSGVPHYPPSSKCRPMAIESEDEDSQDDTISGVYLRRKRRKRKMDGGSGSQVSDSSNNNHNSSAEQKRYLTSPCLTPDPHTACRVIQNKKQIAVDEGSPEARFLVHSKYTPSITSLALKRKASKTLIAQQGKYTLAAEKREHQEISSNCREMSSFSSKQQNKVKPPILKRHQTSPSIPELSTSFQSINKRGKSVDCIEQDQLRSPIKHEQDKTREESMITSPSKERKHTILLENPPHPSKRCKRNSLLWDLTSRHQKEQKLDDSSDTSDNIDEADRVDDSKDTLVLSQLDNDTNLQPHDGDALKISGDESEIQMMSESHDPDWTDALILPRSDSDSEDEMVVDENTSNCIGSSKENAPKFSESASQTQVTATTRSQEGQMLQLSHLGPVALFDQPKFRKRPAPAPMPTAMQTPTQVTATTRSQEGQMLRLSHLGPVALFDQPRFRKRPAPAPMPTAMQTPIPAGPEYVEKLFSSLYQRIEKSSVDLTQNSHATQPQGTINSRAAGTASLSQACLNQPVRGIDYQGQSPVFLPNMYGTLQPAPATEKPKPISRTNPSLCTPGHSWEAPHSALPGSSHVVSSTEQIQPNPTYNHPNPVAEKLYNTFGTSQVTPLQPQASHNQNPQYSYASVPNCSLQQMPWLPKIRPERVTHGKQQETLAIEDLEEALEEVLATRLCSKWWVTGLQQLCASINTKILPYFLRLVLKCIMCADPLEPQKHPNSLPPKLYQLFQVVCIMEQRLTPHHPRGLHNALLRAIQAIISKPDIKITLHSLSSLTAWYIASASIDGQAKAGQEWRRARTFLVDLLFHHPGAIHLALLTAATTSYRIFCKFMQHRVMSGLEQVVVWLAHYGAWVGQPGVRSDLTEWLAQHLKVKKPPQNPAPLIKNLVTLLDPEKKRDLQWGAATSIVVLARWQGWAWTRKHLLPPLLTAAGEISMAVSQQEESCDRDLELNEDFNIKISHLFDNLSQALPCGPEEKDYDDIVEKMKNAVTSIFCSSPSTNCNILTT